MSPKSTSPLLAVLLVTSSSRGATLSFRYPQRPSVEKRFSRVKYLVASAEDEEKYGRPNSNAWEQDEMDEDSEEYSDSTDDEDEDSSDSDETSFSGSDDQHLDGTSDYDRALSYKWDEQRLHYDGTSSAGGTGATREAHFASEQIKRRLRAYQQYLGYDSGILASMLAPKRELCHQKFELVIDDLAFVGHPVCVGEEGIWDPEAEQSLRARGRDPTKKGEVPGYTIDEEENYDKDVSPTAMTLFHLVLVLDRPDPSPSTVSLDLTSWLQVFYDNIAFKMTAALFAEQVRCEYVSHETEKLVALRDRCMDDGQSYKTFLTQALLVSSLACSLKEVFMSIALSSNAFVVINDSFDVHLQLPRMLQDPGRLAQLSDVEAPIDLNDAIFHKEGRLMHTQTDELMFEQWNRTTGPYLLPWKTLLLLHDDRKDSHAQRGDDNESGSNAANVDDSGIEVWAKKFTSLLIPTLEGIPTLADIADLLDWRLEEDVYPMVRHLIYYREARVIDVPHIQNYYAVSPLFDLVDLTKLSTSWALRFPSMPPFPKFLATISSALRPFSTQVPRRDQRQLCLDVLIWLLRHEVVVQMHVRLRLVATEACKVRAATVRQEERKRISAKRKQREALQRRKVLARDKGAASSGAHSSTGMYSQSAPAGDLSADSSAYKSTDSSNSSLDHSGQPKVTSALSATRPKKGIPSSKPETKLDVMSPTPLQTEQNTPLADYELKFERRPVLRSRSPSRVLGMANSFIGAGSQGARTGDVSHPGTPRGRPRNLFQTNPAMTAINQSSESTNAERNSHTHSGYALPQSVPMTSNQCNEAPGVPLDRRTRSPSRARLRVTGFGQDEEVYIEQQDGETGNTEEKQGGVNSGGQRRREEEVGKDAMPPHPSVEVNEDTLAEEGDRFSEDDEYMDYDIDEELWETNPIESIIAEPSRASGDENEWIAAMLEKREAWLGERLYKLLPFLNGKHTVDEIVYRLEWRRKELRAVLSSFREEILTIVHP